MYMVWARPPMYTWPTSCILLSSLMSSSVEGREYPDPRWKGVCLCRHSPTGPRSLLPVRTSTHGCGLPKSGGRNCICSPLAVRGTVSRVKKPLCWVVSQFEFSYKQYQQLISQTETLPCADVRLA